MERSFHEQLLERAVHYVLRNGVGTLSLRPMAKDIGTTARMLMHHFGSKEALVAEVLVAIEEGFARRVAGYVGDERGVRFTLNRMWSDTSAPAMDASLRAMFEVWGQALVHPSRYEKLLQWLTEPWIDMLRRRFEVAGRKPAEAAILATLAIGAFQGLQLVRLTSGDDARCKAALKTLIKWLDAEKRPMTPSATRARIVARLGT
jgi:AcrR family transcriptional regulator